MSATEIPGYVPGHHLGMEFPSTLSQFGEAGCEFLTRAFLASGVLDPDNAVAEITAFEEFFGGGAGRKALLAVRYARPQEGLHENLFVKMPRDFGDPLRDLFAHLMEPEIRFALLSRRNGFPIAVPRCYFADYDPVSVTGLLITERILYGSGSIEAFYDKCLDYDMANPLAHYQALIKVLADLAGAHKAGLLGNDVEQQFPYSADTIKESDLIPYSPEQLDEKLAKLRAFIAQNPGLFPEPLRDEGFLRNFSAQAKQVARLDRTIKLYLNWQTDLVALCHWNANMDNAWFERGDGGALSAGLLDWGSVSQMNVGQGLFGILCACETDFLNRYRADLIQLFADRYRQNGGPAISVESLFDSYRFSVAVLGLAWMIDAPSIIAAELGDTSQIRDRFDPRIRDQFLSRAQLHLLTVFLNEWQQENLGELCLEFDFERRVAE